MKCNETHMLKQCHLIAQPITVGMNATNKSLSIRLHKSTSRFHLLKKKRWNREWSVLYFLKFHWGISVWLSFQIRCPRVVHFYTSFIFVHNSPCLLYHIQKLFLRNIVLISTFCSFQNLTRTSHRFLFPEHCRFHQTCK